MSIFETLGKLRQQRSRPHRIAFLKSLLKLAKPRSREYFELHVALKWEMNGQLKKENKEDLVHRTTAPASAPIGQASEEFA